MLWSGSDIHVCKNTKTPWDRTAKCLEEMCTHGNVYTQTFPSLGWASWRCSRLTWFTSIQCCHSLENQACTFVPALWLPWAFTCIICFGASINTCERGIIPRRSQPINDKPAGKSRPAFPAVLQLPQQIKSLF